MTSRQLYEYTLIELNKVKAPTLLLNDYNYFINKAVSQYVNKCYNLFEINQQFTDNLRVLKSSVILTPSLSSKYGTSSLYGKTYEVDLPDDYLHLTGCIVQYNIPTAFGCYAAGDKFKIGANRATSDIWSQAINNYYFSPKYNTPYYYINNVTTYATLPTIDSQVSLGKKMSIVITETGNILPDSTITINGITYTFKTSPSGTLDVKCAYNQTSEFTSLKYLKIKLEESSDVNITKNNYSGELTITGTDITLSHTCGTNISVVTTITGSDLIDKTADERYGNSSKVRLEIRYGNSTKYILEKLYIDYIKSPKYILLTEDQIDEVDDTSQILEFPDYVCQEIINELVKLLMENASDPRLQSNIPINQTIANPTQQHR